MLWPVITAAMKTLHHNFPRHLCLANHSFINYNVFQECDICSLWESTVKMLFTVKWTLQSSKQGSFCMDKILEILSKNGTGYVVHMGEERGVYRVLLGKLEGKRPLGRPRHRWVDIRMDLQEVGCGYMDWIGLAQDRDRWQTPVSAVMNLRVPWNAGNFLTSCKPVSFSRRTLHHGVSKKEWVFQYKRQANITTFTNTWSLCPVWKNLKKNIKFVLKHFLDKE